LQSAAWNFYKQHKPQIKWDLVVIIPPFVSFLILNLQKSSAIANDRKTGVRGEQWFHLNRRVCDLMSGENPASHSSNHISLDFGFGVEDMV
jgi:hypothetical protein